MATILPRHPPTANRGERLRVSVLVGHDGRVDAAHVALLREILTETGWVDRAEEIGRALRRTRTPGGLLLLGTPQEEPWHLAAHLADESRFHGLPQLEPTLVRWEPSQQSPPHLRVGTERLAEARRGETLFVVSPDAHAPAPLLERVDDARRRGATVLALEQGQGELAGLAHDAIAVDDGSAPVHLDGLQHLISDAAGTEPRAPGRTGWRARVSRFLDLVSGPQLTD